MTEHQQFPNPPADVWAALFTPEGRPRDRWLKIIKSHVFPSTRKKVPDVVQLIFDELSLRYLARAEGRRLPPDVPLEAFLKTRFEMDSGRAAQSIARQWGGESLFHEDGEPTAALSDPDNELLDPDQILEDGRIAARIAELVRGGTLGDRERDALLLRASCSFDAQAVYANHGLTGRERNAHNNAYLVACRKLRSHLVAEGYVP